MVVANESMTSSHATRLSIRCLVTNNFLYVSYYCITTIPGNKATVVGEGAASRAESPGQRTSRCSGLTQHSRP
jgi:hypothetical protein